MRLSTKSRYGVRAIFDIAYYSEGLEAQVKGISSRQGISRRYLEQIFQKLKKAGIVGSRRGPTGGYFLKKSPGEITVGELLRITEGGLSPVYCAKVSKRGQVCHRAGECVTRAIWSEAERRLAELFDSVTIKELCKRADEMGLKRKESKR